MQQEDELKSKLHKGKLYCIKDYAHINVILSDDCYFTKGHIYDLISTNNKDLTLCIIDDDNNRLNFHHESPLFLYDLPNYFINLNDARKLKLEKLANVE